MNKITKTCVICGERFEVHPCRSNKALYCSRGCKAEASTIRSITWNEVKTASGEKKCTKCGTVKPLEQFYKSIHKNDGLDSWCKKCKVEDNRAYVQRNIEEKRKYRKQYHIKNREKHLQQSKRNNIRLKYNIEDSTYQEMIKQQNNRCAICGTVFDSKTNLAHLDHCHDTGRIRGMLCRKCNTGLGMFKDNQELLLKAALYLKPQGDHRQ